MMKRPFSITISPPLILLLVVLVLAAPAVAQDDRAAGLFAAATQLPLVAQSAAVRIDGLEATVQWIQVFANPGPALAQADYRLQLPREARVEGFGFWRDGRFLAAELRERGEAEEAHRAAATAGRATGLLSVEGTTHAFSVYPIAAGELQQVAVTMVLPVVSERGRTHLHLPLERFLGQRPIPMMVTVELSTREPLSAVGVEGVASRVLKRGDSSAHLAFSAERSVDLWWSEKLPPLLVAAEAVALGDGSFGVQLRLLLDDVTRVVGAGAGRWAAQELVVLVDTSYSIRRRSRAVGEVLARLASHAPRPPRLVAVGERTDEVPSAGPGTTAAELSRRVFAAEAGFHTRWSDLATSAAIVGCGDPGRRCLVITDPQVAGLDSAAERLEILLLADPDESAHFAGMLDELTADREGGPTVFVHQPDVDPLTELLAYADELVLPVLEVASVVQGEGALTAVGTPRWRAAEGALLRAFARSHSLAPVVLELAIGGRALRREVEIELLDPDSPQGQALRRGVFRELLASWVREYRRERDPELREQIVEVSLREGIPTPLTALHVADPVGLLPATATPAPLLRFLGVAMLALGGLLWRRRGRPA